MLVLWLIHITGAAAETAEEQVEEVTATEEAVVEA